MLLTLILTLTPTPTPTLTPTLSRYEDAWLQQLPRRGKHAASATLQPPADVPRYHSVAAVAAVASPKLSGEKLKKQKVRR